MIFLSNLVNGISLGSIYAIIALGYTMVYGIAKMLNFAHGDVIMVGAFLIFSASQYWNLPPAVSILLAMLVCTGLGITIEKLAYKPLRQATGLAVLITAIGMSYLLQNTALLIAMLVSTALGITIEKLAYKPLRQATSLAVLITAIGMSYLLQNTALLIWGANPKVFPDMLNIGSISLFSGQLQIKGETLITILVNIVIMVALTLFISRSRMGKAMRCVSEDKGAAELMGINVNTTISVTFAIGSALAAIAGLLLCSSYPMLQPTTGSMPGIKAFTAAVFGGIGSIPGAMLGGVLLGVIEILGKAYISTELGDAIVFAVLIIVLLVRPTGLLGKPVREKV